MMKKFNWTKYSAENRERIRKVIKIVSDDFELQEINRLAGNKIPFKRFENESISHVEVVEILKTVQRDFDLFKIGNLEIEKMMEYPSYIFDSNRGDGKNRSDKEILKKLKLTGDDIKDNIIIRAKDLNITDRLKEILVEIDNISQETNNLPENWGWADKKNGKYQFGNKDFTQGGKVRKKVFIALMEACEKSPNIISVTTLHEQTDIERKRLRVEISAINKNLRSQKIGLRFKGSGKGFYEVIISKISG